MAESGATSADGDARGEARPGEDQGTRIRRLALEILLTAEGSRRFVDEVFAERLGELGVLDRRLLQEIVYGSVRHRNSLDHLLDFHLRKPTATQRPAARWALRTGAFQVVYLSRVPAHAALNQTLEALKRMPGIRSRDVGFVNAVLHSVLGDIRAKDLEPPVDRDDTAVLPVREGYCRFHRPFLPARGAGLARHLSLKHSHPEWLIERWLARLGEEEVRALCEAQNRIPVVTARVTARAPGRGELIALLGTEGFEVEAGRLENAIRFRRGGDFEKSSAFARGWLQIQDETAIRIGGALRPPSGASVLDLCAAPGGKAMQLMDAVGPEGRVVAADRSAERVALLEQNLARAGAWFRAVIVPEDPAALDLGETFTHVLVDAPCSNTGVLARRPEARWRLRPEDLRSLHALQSALLEAALRHLEPGGRVLYSTCSIEPEENEDVAGAACAAHPELTELETQLFLPHRTGSDGGFYSLLRRGLNPDTRSSSQSAIT
jgi:16S rRNA (cytosine967-C5)-methyltransferase